MRLVFFTSFLFLFSSSLAQAGSSWISVDQDLFEDLEKIRTEFHFTQKTGKQILVSLDDEYLPYVSHIAHEKYGRCGGYILEESPQRAHSLLGELKPTHAFHAKDLQNKPFVREWIEQVSEGSMVKTIEKLSSYQNRYFQSQFGVESQKWLMEQWNKLAESRDDVSVELFSHRNFRQPSVILTVEGLDPEAGLVIIGGHGDSTAGWFTNSSTRAPGADDNASGIATITETLRIFLESGKRPIPTVQFISYAAEEAGLRGSSEIAKTYSEAGKDVKGALQFDMTNFEGSEYDFVFMTDFTTDSLSSYLTSLVEMYLPSYTWAFDKCGYACSDHASWFREGFPSAFPFESMFKDNNRAIHSRHDTLEVSDHQAKHAAKFARLAVAFLGEYTLE